MKKSVCTFIITPIVLLFSSYCNATLIQYTTTNITGNTWQYDYSITNDTLGIDIEEFSILFDVSLYNNLTLPVVPIGWDPIVFQPDISLPDDGIYDALALVSGITPNTTLGGFSVQFDFLGSSTPGTQVFNIIDPSTFDTIEFGFTTQKLSQVPLPPSLFLMITGLLILFSEAKRKSSRRLRDAI